MEESNYFDTRVIHGGQISDKAYGSVMTPVYLTTTFAQESPGVHQGYTYARSGNPTRSALERSVASLEAGKYGLAFSSGLSAIDAVLRLFKPGDEVITTTDLYGGTYRLFKKVFEPLGIVFHYLDLKDPTSLLPAVNNKSKLVWIESPTNPMMNILDIGAIARLCKKHKLLLAVDNTFASPYLQNPLGLGADIVMHSATKYLGGHSDVIAGVLILNDKALAKRLYFVQNAGGAILGPMESFLILRGIKTLSLRMQRHCENGRKVAEFLKSHPKVEKVYWPGFPEHPNHDVARKQMKNFGGMLSFIPKGASYSDTIQIVNRLKIFTLAESLGGVESLVGHPASMTHASVPEEERRKNGIVDAMIRLSVGIEDARDLIMDLDRALNELN